MNTATKGSRVGLLSWPQETLLANAKTTLSGCKNVGSFLECLPFKMVCVFRFSLFDAQFCYIVDAFPVPICFCRAPKSIWNTRFTFLLPFRIVTYCAFSQSASLWHNFLCLNEIAYRQLSHIHFSLTNRHELMIIFRKSFSFLIYHLLCISLYIQLKFWNISQAFLE